MATELTDQQQADIVERILAGVEHDYRTPETCSCTSDLNCPVCFGGLVVCRVCGLSEGALTTDCPRIWVSMPVVEAIYKGKQDFREGQWVAETSPHSPAAYR